MLIRLVTTVVLLAASLSAQAGLSIVGSRIIYKEDGGEITVQLRSLNAYPVLVQAWLDDGDEAADPGSLQVPFILSPTVSRIEAHRGQSIRVLRTGGSFPADRETLLWFNVLEIPPAAQTLPGESILQIGGRARMKFFYRPKGLRMPSERAPEHLQFSVARQTQDGHAQLLVRNSSPYYVSFDGLTVRRTGDAEEAAPLLTFRPTTPTSTMVPPMGEALMLMEGNPGLLTAGTEVAYLIVNDYGGKIAGTQRLGGN